LLPEKNIRRLYFDGYFSITVCTEFFAGIPGKKAEKTVFVWHFSQQNRCFGFFFGVTCLFTKQANLFWQKEL
jgi:hypothetical protein